MTTHIGSLTYRISDDKARARDVFTWTRDVSEVRQIVELAGVTYRQLDYWVRKGWLQPARVAAGSGIPRLWPEEEFRVAVIMGRLVVAGLDPAVAVQAARQLVADRYPTTHLAPGITITVTGDGL